MPKNHTKKRRSLPRKSPRKSVIQRCQAITLAGRRCTRNAVIDLDLANDKEFKLLGYKMKIPLSKLQINCCNFCSQHALIKVTEMVDLVTKNVMNNDQYDMYVADEYVFNK